MLPILLSAMFTGTIVAGGLTIPSSDVAISDSISSELPVPYTAEEIATPPVGEIRKKYLREVDRSRSGLAAVLGGVSEGPDGQQSPLFAKLQKFKTGLDQLA